MDGRRELTAEAMMLRRHVKLVGPELLVAECADILWKRVQRDRTFLGGSAPRGTASPQAANIEFLPTRSLLETATRTAVELDYPAY